MTYDIFSGDTLLHTGIVTMHDADIWACAYSRDESRGTVYVYPSGSYPQDVNRIPAAAYKAGERIELPIVATAS